MTLLGIFSPLLWILYAIQSEFPGLYDHSFKLYSANKLIQRKMLFWCFFRPQPERSFGVSVCLSYVRPSVIAFLFGLEVLARTSSYLEKTLFWQMWQNSAISGGRIWSKTPKGTLTPRDLSLEPIS